MIFFASLNMAPTGAAPLTADEIISGANFPKSPEVNSRYSFGGYTWKYSGAAWELENRAAGDTTPFRVFPPRDPGVRTGTFIEPSSLFLACSTLNQTDQCIESIEYFDPETKSWVKGVEQKNPYFKVGTVLPLRDESSSGAFQCGTGNHSNADVCFLFPKAAVDGKDQYLVPSIGAVLDRNGLPRISIRLEPLNGGDPRKPLDPRVNSYLVMKPGSTWRVTVIGDKILDKAGLAWSWMKNGSVDIVTGSDGKTRLITTGTIQEINELRSADGGRDPRCNEPNNELTANNFWASYLINMDPYAGEYEVLQGSPAGGVFLNSNGGCDYGVKIDRVNNKIIVVATGPHFDVFGQKIMGWVEASIRGDVVRKVFRLEPKTMREAIVEVTDSNGQVQTATFTTQYVPTTDKVEIKGYGFSYSKKTISISFEKVPETSSTKPSSGGTQTPSSGSTGTATATPTVSSPSTRTLSLKQGMTIRAKLGETILLKSTAKGSWLSAINNKSMVKVLPVTKSMGSSVKFAFEAANLGQTVMKLVAGGKAWNITLIVSG